MTTHECRPLNGEAVCPGAARGPAGGTEEAREWANGSPGEREPSAKAAVGWGDRKACRTVAARTDPASGDWSGVAGGGGEQGGGREGGDFFSSETASRDSGSWRRNVGARVAPDGSTKKSICGEDNAMSFPKMQPHQRISVVFEDLEVSSKSFFSRERKKLLHGVSGQFRAGELVAVMGPSGAGKTTLLNTISGFTSGMMSGGSVRLQYEDGHITKKRNVACYLTQEDHVHRFFTVREIVQQAADIKVGSRLSRKARALLVDDVLETLGLKGCSNTRASQLSGGQRKRLAIAAELVDNPAVVFLDEPTSGLDMSNATQCAQLMQRIAHSGRAVICTIHQPSENILSMFDQLYVLANGRCVYRGSPSDIIPYLSSLGFQCPKYHNPADFLLEVASNDYGVADEVLEQAVAQRSSDYPPPMPAFKECEANGKRKEHQSRNGQIEALITANNYQPSEWERFRVLVTRNLLTQHRDWVSTQIKIVASVLVFLLIGILFGKLGDNAERVFSNVSVLYMIIFYMCYTPEAPGVMKYSDEIQVVKREWFNNWYQLYTYSFALLISALPLHVMTCTISCSITYYMTGQLAEPMRFAHVTLATILTSIASESLGLQFGSLFLKKKIVSLFIASTHLAYMILFSGFFALKPEMPFWFDWFTKTNHMHFGLNLVVIAVYKDRGRLDCPEDYCHFRDSESVLKLFGLANAQLWENFLALVIMIVVLRLTGYFTLTYNMKYVSL